MEKMERVNATSLVVNSVKLAIQKGKLKVGDRLPKEAEMCKELGVGRSSLREGIKILNAYGVVESRQGDGTYIIDHSAQNFFEFMGFVSTQENMTYFLELRRVLETGNIISIYDKLTPRELDELERLVVILNQKRPINEYVEADQSFHHMMLSYSKNPMIMQINNMINAMRRDLLYKLFADPAIVKDAYQAHTAILSALREQDMEACIQAVISHIDTTVEHTRNL